MPGIIAEYNPNNRDVNELGSAENQQRQKMIEAFWKYYDGDHHRWLKTEPGERDDNIVINLSGRAVDKMGEFIGIPKAIQLAQDAAADGTPDPMQEQLKTWWNGYRRDFPEVVQSGLIGGHIFQKLYLKSDGKVAFTQLDPKYVTVFWDTLNVKQTLFYRMEWMQGNKRWRQDIVPDWLLNNDHSAMLMSQPTANYWMIIDYQQWGQSWRKMNEQAWEHPFAPIVDWPNKRRAHSYYGVSMLSGGKAGLNDAVNFVSSNTGRIIKYNAHPKTFLFGAQIDDDDGVGAFWDDLPTDARVETIELKSDLQSSMRFGETLKSEFFSATRVLDTATVQDKLGQITNFGVRMLFNDQIEARQEATMLYGDGLAEVFRRMLIVDGYAVDGKPETVWDDALPVNRNELLQGAQIESGLGTTSKETIATDIGRDYKTEQEKMSAEGMSSSDNLIAALQRGGQKGLFG